MPGLTAGLLFLCISDLAIAKPDDSEPYPHPFLTEDGQKVIEELRTTLGTSDLEEILRHIITEGMVVEDEEGWRKFEWIRANEATLATVGRTVTTEPVEIPLPTMGTSLDMALLASSASEELEVEMCIRRQQWRPVGTLSRDIDLAVLRGEVSTWGDIRQVRHERHQNSLQIGADTINDFLMKFEQRGVVLHQASRVSGCLTVLAPTNVVEEMIADPIIASAELAEQEIMEDAGYSWTVEGPTLTGYELEDLIQSTQFYEEGYSGDERIAIVDGDGPVYRMHLGFDDASGIDRVENCGNPDSNDECQDNLNPDTGAISEVAAHANAATSMVLGDITADQDTDHTNDIPQRRRSGVARGATALAITLDDDWSDIILAESPEMAMMVKVSGGTPTDSSGDYNNTVDCTGTETNARKLNYLFEEGVAVFQSAGNTGHGASKKCKVRPLAAAMGAFTVGAYRVSDPADNEVIDNDSARGGTSDAGGIIDGGGRTIIDLMGPARYKNAYPHYDARENQPPKESFYYGTDWGSDGIPNDFPNTSSSTPVVAGAAALFREWWLDDIGSAINNPERLYVQMLLMGDRTGESSTLTTGFDGLWGAGKLRLRKYDAAGMDAPAGLRWGNTCVDDEDYVYIDLHPSWQTLPGDINMLKTVIWWYDTRHDDGTAHAKIDLAIQWDDNSTWTDVATSETDDNRQHVYIEPNNVAYRAEFYGRDVSGITTSQGCGTDSIKVWFAAYMEDSDRDDGEPSEIVPPYVRTE